MDSATGLYIALNPDNTTLKIVGFDESSAGHSSYVLNTATGALTIPQTILHSGTYKTVTVIGDNAFNAVVGIISVQFPNTIVSIEEYAFYMGSDIQSINFGLNAVLTTIGDAAFLNCTSLSTVKFPSTLVSIGANAFGTSVLTSITLPSALNVIGNAAFGYIGILNTVVFLGGYKPDYNPDAFIGTFSISTMTTTDLPSWPARFGGANYFKKDAGGGHFYGQTLTQASGGGGAVACFAEGTRVLTQNGYKAIEALQFTDMLVTADQRIIDFKLLKTTLGTTTERTAPYLIQPHAFGRNAPSAPIRLSATHKIQVRKGLWTSPATAALTNPLVKQCAVGGPVTYYHIECENYLQDNIVTEGLVVESFATLKTTGGRTDIYTWNSRKNAYTRLGNMDSAKSKSA